MPKWAACLGAMTVLLIAQPAVGQLSSGEFGFSKATYVVTEFDGAFRAPYAGASTLPTRTVRGALITVTRSQPALGRVAVDYSTIDTNTASCGDTNSTLAVPDCDFFATSGTLFFDHLEMSKSFVVGIGSDGVISGTREAFIELSNPRLDDDEALFSLELLPPVLGSTDQATIRILEHVTLPTRGTNFVIERATYTVDENRSGNNVLNVNIDILHPSGSGGNVRVNVGGSDLRTTVNTYLPLTGSDYANVSESQFIQPFYTDGTGPLVDPQDFFDFSQTLNFAQGERRKTVTLQITNDTTVEFNEDFKVYLTRASNTDPPVGPNASALVTILFDDPPAGALDREWNPDYSGYTRPAYNLYPGANNIVRAVAVQADQKTIIAGDFTAYNSFPRSRIARINVDGSHDDTFEPGSGADDFVTALAIHSNQGAGLDGKIVVVGGFSSMNNLQRNGVARLNADGSLDATFSPGTGANGIVRSVALQSDGKVLIAGEFTQVNGLVRAGIARLNTDGSVDLGFDPGNGPDGLIWTVSVFESGARKIFVGGDFLEFSGAYCGNVARLNDNGSFDAGFDAGGGTDGPVYALLPLSDGRLIVGGAFSTVDYASSPTVARLLSNGRLDGNFEIGSGANGSIFTLALQSDGKIFAGGLFTSFNGTRRFGLARLFSGGPLDTSFLDTAYNQFAGLPTTYHFEAPNYVNSIAVQADGGVMIGGSFYQVGGNYSERWGEFEGRASRPAYVGSTSHVWTRADKRPRMNVARLVGGYTPGPGNIGFAFPQNPGDEDTGVGRMRITRLDGRLGAASVDRYSTDNIAIAPQDYTSVSDSPDWDADAQSGAPFGVGETIPYEWFITLIPDNFIEGDETLFLTLTNPVGSLNLSGEIIPLGTALGTNSTVFSITDDDFNKGILAFERTEYVTNEGPASLRVTVVRTNGASGQISVRYYTRDGSATQSSDYTSVSGTLTFGSGVTVQTILIPVLNDVGVEADEDFFVVLTNAVGGAVIAGGPPTLPAGLTNSQTARAVIIDNDFQPGKANFSSATTSTNESAVSAQVTLVRLGGSVGQLSVSVAAASGTATAGSDFTGVTNTITWVNGDVAPKILNVPIADDFTIEADETVLLRIFSPSVSGGVGSVSNATLTIVNDDFPGQLSFSQAIYDADERGTNLTVFVVRSGGVGGTVTANYSFANGTATNGIHFGGTAGTLAFGPGVTATNFEVTITDDALEVSGGLRSATMNLGGFTGGASAGTFPTATLRIIDDESVNDLAGSLDTFFNARSGGTNAIHVLAIQPDEKILVGGEFRTLNRVSRSRVGRLNPDGTLDGSFNKGSGPNGAVRAMSLQGNGRILIGGAFTQVNGTNRNYLARLLADGTLDTQFNPGAGPDNPVYAMALLPDDRVVIGGAFASVNGISRPGLAVLNTNGTVSTAFTIGQGFNGTVYAVAVQNDGKILVGGDFTTVNGSSHPRIVRLLLDGSVDLSFDAGSGPNGTVRALALQSDGKILVGGAFTDVNGTARGRLVRLTSSGGLDTGFMAAVDGGNADVSAIAIQYDGKILVGGEFSSFNGVTRNRITRLNRNGKTDPTINFGDGANDAVNALAIQTDRKVVLAGRFSSYDGQPRQFMARIHGGSIAGPGILEFTSASYDVVESAGSVTVMVKRRGGTSSDVTVDYYSTADTATPDLDYTNVIGTLTFLEGETRQSIVVPVVNDAIGELTETAYVTLSNATPGVVIGEIPVAALNILNDDSGVGFSAATYSINESSSGGGVLITVQRSGATNGTFTVQYATTNITALAGADYTARSGLLVFNAGQTELSFAVPILDDDLIEPSESFGLLLSSATGGTSITLGTATVTIVDNDFRAGDLTFSATAYSVAESDGVVSVPVIRTNGFTGVLTVDYRTVAGTATAGADYLSQTGTLVFNEGQTNVTITLVIQEDAFVEGDEVFHVQLLNPSPGTIVSGLTNVPVTIVDEETGPGSVDRTFDPGTGANGIVRSVNVDTNGAVLVGGSFTVFNGVARNYVARLASDGALDTNFVTGSGPNGLVVSVAPASGNGVVIAGSFVSVNGTSRNRVARLTSAGALDSSFTDFRDLNASVYNMVVQADGRMLLGGAFSQPTRGIARLLVSGQIDNTLVTGTGVNGAVHAMAVQSGGGVILGGNFTSFDGESHVCVARINESGLVDSGFLTGAITTGTVFCVAIQQDGKILLGGDFATSASTNRVNLARLNEDGSLDGTFNVGTGPNSIVYAIGLQSDGNIIIGGDFTAIDGTPRGRFARLSSSGGLDGVFDPGSGANNTVYSLVVLPDDNLLIAGNFSTVGGIRRNGVARVVASTVAASLSAVASSAGSFSLSLSVVPGRLYVLEASADLRNWTPVFTNLAVTASWQFNQPNPGAHQTRFYRMREVRP